MNGEVDKPEWWLRNERDRDHMDLPAYEPPTFEDGVYVHEVVDDLEEEYECDITLMGINVEYSDEWQVRVDGDPKFAIERSRNENGNTVYHVASDTFRQRIGRVSD